MELEKHCEHTRVVFGKDYREIHEFLDKYFDYIAFEKQMSCTDGDYYSEHFDFFAHRKILHHAEGIELVVDFFKQKGYDEDIIRKVAQIHVMDDYSGYIPLKKDFENLDFLKKYH
jgi:CBS domain-containing protein